MGAVKKAPLSQQNSSHEKETTASSPKSSFLPESSLEDAWDEKGEKTESQTARGRRMPWASHALAPAHAAAVSLASRKPPQAGSALCRELALEHTSQIITTEGQPLFREPMIPLVGKLLSRDTVGIRGRKRRRWRRA